MGRSSNVNAPAKPGAYYQASIGLKELYKFKSSWPCHGLPDNLARVVFEYDPRGDLVDITCTTRRGKYLTSEAFDGPALVALADQAQRKVNPRHADERAPR